MLIPFGVFSAAGAGNGAGASYELISTTLISTNTASVAFNTSALSNYKHLQVRITSRTNRADNAQDTILMRFNADSTSGNYNSHYIQGNGSAVSSTDGGNKTGIYVGTTVTATNTANVFSGHIIDILDFNSGSKNKTARTLSGMYGTNKYVELMSGFRINTAAITEVAFVIASANSFVSGSKLSLYGLRG